MASGVPIGSQLAIKIGDYSTKKLKKQCWACPGQSPKYMWIRLYFQLLPRRRSQILVDPLVFSAVCFFSFCLHAQAELAPDMCFVFSGSLRQDALLFCPDHLFFQRLPGAKLHRGSGGHLYLSQLPPLVLSAFACRQAAQK